MLRTNTPIQSNAVPDGIWHRVGAIRLNDWRISAYSLLLVSIFLIIVSNLVRGDDLTGQAIDDPKDLMPAQPRASAPQSSGPDGQFVSMPAWARGNVLPPLPAELNPMGGKTAVAKPPPPPQPLAPPKETATVVTTTTGQTPAPAASTEKTSANSTDNNPALIAVSPFLQWIKNNPQAAATQARQQADSYHAGTSSDSSPVNGVNGIGHSPIVAPGGSGDPYWLPPLIDSADFGTAPVGGSAAIYSTPQR
jgi:hypothetical protein